MSSIVLMLREPELFAAGMLVAGQWDPSVMAPMAKDKLWVLVAQGDQKASAGMNAAMDVWSAAGASISRAVWNGQASAEEAAANVAAMTAENSNIKYVQFANGTVVPENQSASSNANHISTWRIAYNIEGVRDWLFKQVKMPKP
jgi:predicted peptidase